MRWLRWCRRVLRRMLGAPPRRCGVASDNKALSPANEIQRGWDCKLRFDERFRHQCWPSAGGPDPLGAGSGRPVDSRATGERLRFSGGCALASPHPGVG